MFTESLPGLLNTIDKLKVRISFFSFFSKPNASSSFFLDPKRVSIWRYEDPNLGPRKIPTCEDLERGKVRLADSASFVVDISNNCVKVQEDGSSYDIGGRLVYMVNP